MVDTSQLIKDEHDLFSSRLFPCFFDNDQLSNLIVSLPTKNVLSRIFYEKTRLRPDRVEQRKILGKDRCLMSPDIQMLRLLKIGGFLFAERKVLHLLLAMPVFVESMPNKMWLREMNYEYNLVTYYRRDKPRLGKE